MTDTNPTYYALYKGRTLAIKSFGILLAAMLVCAARAAEGPGFPNVTRPSNQSGLVLSLNDPGKAISAVAMHRGYLFVPLGADHGGGRGNGAFAFYDISSPINPTIVFDSRDHPSIYHDSDSVDYVGDFAEVHHMPISGDHVMISEHRGNSAGYSILDLGPFFDNPSDSFPRVVSRFSYPGVTSPTNYDGFSFAPGWQGNRYLWAPTGSNGLMVVDTSDYASPQIVAQIPRSALSNLTLRSAIVIGNLLLIDTVAVGGTYTSLVMDVSDPANPRQVNSFTGPLGYQTFIYGGKHYGGGVPLVEHDFSDPQNITSRTFTQSPRLDRPEYGFGKDGFIFIGHYPGLTKWQLNSSGATFVESIDSGLARPDDHAFITPIGNMAAVTSDHNNTRKLILGVHDTARDTTPPEVNFNSPADGETNAHVKSRIGICFTDFIDPTSVNATSLVVRELGGGTVSGTYSTMQGIVNFAPDADLSPDTTYSVILSGNGLTDQSGNAIPEETHVATFSTGSAISGFITTVVADSPLVTGSAATLSLTVENPGNFSLEHSWDFGDGSPPTSFSSATSIDHQYADPGNHVVTVSTRISGQADVTQSTAVQVIHSPLASTPPTFSSTIIFDEFHDFVWNVNPDSNSVSAIHATNNTKTHEIPVGSNPKSLALAPGDQLWVANKEDSTISVIDRSTASVLHTIDLPHASAPHGLIVDVSNNLAYVSLEGTGQIAKIDTSTRMVTALLGVGPWPRGLGLDPLRQRLWVSRFISPDEAGILTAIDTASFLTVTSTLLPPVMEPDSLFNGRGLPNYLGSPAISPDLTQAYLPAKKDNIFRGLQRDGLPLNFEHTVRSMATRIDLASASEDATGRIDFDNSDFATAAVFSPLGNQIFFTTNGSATIWVADAYDPSNVFTFTSGGLAPDGLTLNSDGSRLFVHNFMSRSVVVFRTDIICSSECGTAPQLADISTVTNELLTSDVLRGKQLFYDSSDPRLSQESYMSCASCHIDGGHDGRVWDFTNFGEGLRNTIDLNGRGIGHGPAHWSANFDETQDFEGQIRAFSGGSGLMSDTDFNHGTRSQPLGLAKAGSSEDLDAIAAYIASLTSAGESPYRNADNSLTSEAVVGREIFESLDCASCHSGSAFTDSASLTRHDVGTLTPASGERLGGLLDGLDTPTLRGVWQGAPYLHDGSAATLRDVLTSRNLGGHHGELFSLGETQIDQLIAYLKQIDDHEPTAPTSSNNLAPNLTDPGSRTGTLNHSLQLAILAVDPESDLLKFSASGLPAGLAIDPDTGIIAGTPLSFGEHSVRIGVRDTAGNSDSVSFSWVIADNGLRAEDISVAVGPYRYVRLVPLSAPNDRPWASMAEFDLLDANGQLIDRSGWIASASSAESSSSNDPASDAIDGNIATIWHTRYSGSNVPRHPHEFILDLNQPEFLSGFRQTPRTGTSNGRILGYEFYGSTDGSTWEMLDSGTFPNNDSAQTVLLTAAQGITREWWNGVDGNSVADLKAWPDYPDTPTGSQVITSFRGPSNFGSRYGSRIHGYLVPPVTGSYRFAIASNNGGELRLGTSHQSSSATVIASVASFVNPLEWDRFPSQQSAMVRLEAGRLYAISALHKENFGADHIAVAWQQPGSESFEVISGDFLLPAQQLSLNDAPAFGAAVYEFTIPENSASGMPVGQVNATELDTSQLVTHQIVAGNSANHFAIDSSTGMISVAGALDFESQQTYSLLVEAKDDAEPALSVTVPVTIQIGNILENNAEVVFVELTRNGGAYPGHGNPALVGFNADPDQDGVPNAIELLRGTLPNEPDAPAGMRLGQIEEEGKTYMTYEIDVASHLDGVLNFGFLAGDDLDSWLPLEQAPEFVSSTFSFNTWRIRDDVAMEDATRRFIRISINPN